MHKLFPILISFSEIEPKPFPQSYATALFSFLYHLASYDNGELIFSILTHVCTPLCVKVFRIIPEVSLSRQTFTLNDI